MIALARAQTEEDRCKWVDTRPGKPRKCLLYANYEWHTCGTTIPVCKGHADGLERIHQTVTRRTLDKPISG